MDTQELTTLSSRGQVVLPQSVRDRLGLSRGQRLAVQVDGRRIVLHPLPVSAPSETLPGRGGWRTLRGCLRGSDALGQLMAEHAAEVQRGR